MSIERTDIHDQGRPAYRAIADALERSIGAGDFAPGERLPPVRDMAKKLGVTVGTVNRAYVLAQSRGLLTGEVGRGTFVLKRPDRQSRIRLAGENSANAADLVVNQPPVVLSDAEAADTAARALATGGAALLGRYPPTSGLPEHRAALAAWVARIGLTAQPDQILLTAGVHSALAVTALACLRPGDTVLIDQLTYPGARDLLGALKFRVEPVATDEHGLMPDSVETAVRVFGARALFTCPTLQNPTAITMPDERRQQIAEVVERNDLLLVEDDIYGHLPQTRPIPFAARLPKHAILVSGMSKCLAPGLRLGYIVAPPERVGAITTALHDLLVAASPLPAALFTWWLNEGFADEILARIRRQIALRREIAGSVLGAAPPEGSLHQWLPLPSSWTAERLVEEAARIGVHLPRSDVFAVGRTPPPKAVRLALGSIADEEHLRMALRRLRGLLDQSPPRAAPVI
ncbi:MAG TPA: PLP-dependent aminotransferase family protein [Geminicoccus sp.]|jgi:DNA-binding transcriptional MocR family regulator|uniref:aminotransferase-like domain-containing protein n=1 Tax=Geminicoccus sp. TaxID=2024832 RepID=UPI002E3205B2|nr:PLP-dependent aminotransferase family protein [Geminicoccus sp.]HEX2526852.1 PLP-dependent aminotransferase family protein [Geminicoccus sp.]